MRLFIALDLPADVRAGLARWARAEVGADERLRLVGEESLHATLAFLGERADGEHLAATLVSVLGEGTPAPPLRVDGALWLSPRRPHVLTVRLADPSGGLAAIHRAVVDALVREHGYEPERRAHTPHVTVARVRRRVRPFAVAEPPALAFDPPAVTLYRSRLGRGPATYEAVASAPLSTLP